MAKNILLWLAIVVVLTAVFQRFSMQPSEEKLDYSNFVREVQSGKVQRVTIDGLHIEGQRVNGSPFSTIRPAIRDDLLMDELLENNVIVEGTEPQGNSLLVQLFIAAFPFLLIFLIFMFFARHLQNGLSGRGGSMSFGRSKAKLLSENNVKTSFADVAGVDEAKEDVQELVEFLLDPSRFHKVGGRIPRGILMVGPPGTGKTLLAKAIAGEAKAPFFSISGSDFVEMFVGVGASRVRDMFEQAKKRSPCIIFIDEIDAVGRHRGAGLGGGHDEREQTLNQLLVEMDGFENNDGVIVIAATNRPDVLDPALLRPGRFDRQVVVSLPDIRGREQILKVHMRSVPLKEDVDPSIIARGTPGFSGADLANLVNEAALLTARSKKQQVAMEQFDLAKDKIMMGAERRSMVMSDKEKRNTAYHESGHAIVGRLLTEHDPVYKVSIIPRGRALGVTMFLPEEDRYTHSRKGILGQICGLFGGRIAEELILGKEEITTGAANDISRATEIARKMVTRWGLSVKMGPLSYDDGEEEIFLGRSMATQKTVSPETAYAIDKEVRHIVDLCYAKAKKLLEDNIDKLHAMADALMQYETIDAHQIDDIMAGRSPRPYGSDRSNRSDNDDSMEGLLHDTEADMDRSQSPG